MEPLRLGETSRHREAIGDLALVPTFAGRAKAESIGLLTTEAYDARVERGEFG